MNKWRSFPWSQRGQGLVEYVLLLVVVVTIALAFMNLFAKPYAKWAQQHIGDYVECLLDQGELPALGGPNLIQDCDQSDPEFGDGTASSSSSASSGGEDSKDKSNAESSSDNGRGGAMVSSDGSSFKRRRVGAMDGTGANNKKIDLGTQEQKSENGLVRVGGSRYGSTRTPVSTRARGLAGMLEMEQAKIRKREQKTQKVSGAEGSESSRQAKKFSVEPKSRKVAEADLSSGEWGFGKLFRFLLILVLIIALVLFIGGQLMQISKGMEK